MSFNKSQYCLPSAQSKTSRSADLNEDLRNRGAPLPTTTWDAQMLQFNDPHSRFDFAAYDAELHDFYPAIPPPSIATTQLLEPQLPVDVGEDINATLIASRERIPEEWLIPVSVGSTSKVDPMVSKKRKTVYPKGVTGRVIGKKVDIACVGCRESKQKCGGEKPSCSRCMRMNRVCRYVPGQQALKKISAGLAVPAPKVFQRSKPVIRAAGGKSRPKAPPRTLLPRPETPAATFEALAADSQAVPLAVEFNERTAWPPGLRDGPMQNLENFDWEFARLAPVSERGAANTEFETGFGGLDAGTFGDFPPPQQAISAYGGYTSQLNEPLPFQSAPGFPVPGSVWSLDWNSPSTRRPSLASEATANWAERPLVSFEDPETEFM